MYNFNPRSREGSDGKTCFATRASRIFQSTLPRGERHHSRQDIERDNYISIHAPARGATSQKGCLSSGLRISIHAPARGATVDDYCQECGNFISIHAPARGATRIIIGKTSCFKYFNPRSREGSDVFAMTTGTANKISIHAPARGATFSKMWSSIVDYISIHAPARGAT